jgi:hypothetical protein
MSHFNPLARAIATVLQRLRRGIFSPPGMPSPEHLTSTGWFMEPLEPWIIADMSLLATVVDLGDKFPDAIQMTCPMPSEGFDYNAVVMQFSSSMYEGKENGTGKKTGERKRDGSEFTFHSAFRRIGSCHEPHVSLRVD